MDTINIYPSASARVIESLTLPSSTSTATLTSTNMPFTYIGKAEKSYNNINVLYRITSAGVTITWAEMAIYALAQPMGIGTQQVLRRMGVISTASDWTSTGTKITTIPVSGIKKGDDLYIVMGMIGSTYITYNCSNTAEPISSVLQCIDNAPTTWRPSVNEMLLATNFTNAQANMWIAWQGY